MWIVVKGGKNLLLLGQFLPGFPHGPVGAGGAGAAGITLNLNVRALILICAALLNIQYLS